MTTSNYKDTLLFALTGLPASGKSTLSRFIFSASDHAKWVKTRLIIAELTRSTPDDDLQSRGMQFMTEKNSCLFLDALLSEIECGKLNIIDSLRPRAHWYAIREHFRSHAVLVSVHVDDETRRMRLTSRDEHPLTGYRDEHRVEMEVPSLMEQSTIQLYAANTPRESAITLLDAAMGIFSEREKQHISLNRLLHEVRADVISESPACR